MSTSNPAAKEIVARHVGDPIEGLGSRTLCGLVAEGDPTIELEVPVMADVAETVTCFHCRQIIAECIALYTPNFRRRA